MARTNLYMFVCPERKYFGSNLLTQIIAISSNGDVARSWIHGMFQIDGFILHTM